jgi:hypothetical protein
MLPTEELARYQVIGIWNVGILTDVLPCGLLAHPQFATRSFRKCPAYTIDVPQAQCSAAEMKLFIRRTALANPGQENYES